MLRITKCDVLMLSIDLDRPFELAFGQLNNLPRVIIKLTGRSNRQEFIGVGEAAIDFPFVSYDMWDVYYCLSGLKLVGRDYPSVGKKEILKQNVEGRLTRKYPVLPPLPLSNEEINLCLAFPAALAAVTAACDDLWGKAHGISLTKLTSVRTSGPPMVSLGFSDVSHLKVEANTLIKRGSIPKIKLGQGQGKDLDVLSSIAADIDLGRNASLSADFNGSYRFAEFQEFLDEALERNLDFCSFITLEQPISPLSSQEELGLIKKRLVEDFGWSGSLVADESVLNSIDAVRCINSGWSVNYKVQKLGGFREAIRIAEATNYAAGMVGGTFPTAIGRAYDLWVVSSLGLASLPSDAWEPSTDWFKDDCHLIKEDFPTGPKGETLLLNSPGLGFTVDWEKVLKFALMDPKAEYLAIRQGGSGEKLRIRLREGVDYPSLYAEKSGKEPLWNLR